MNDSLKVAEKFSAATCDICKKDLAICSITGHGFGLCLDCYVELVDKGMSWDEETRMEEIKSQLEGKLEPEPPPMVEA